MSFFRSKHLVAAHALTGRHTPTSRELALARRMAREGKTLAEVHTALGWDCCIVTTKRRLQKVNIIPLNPMNRAHRGYETVLQKAVGFEAYRPVPIEVDA